MTAKPYNRMSVAEKERHNRTHDVPDRCPHCGLAVQSDDLLEHIDKRCKGRPEPGPRARWISWTEARALGLTKRSLGQLAGREEIRTRKVGRRKSYLKRDVVKYLALNGRARERARSIRKTTRAVSEPLSARDAERLRAVLVIEGSQPAAGEVIGVPERTIRRAIHGKRLRRGTRLAITLGVDKALKGRK